ncbi:MAG: transposase [Bacteroidota bacterium]|nr:transposase [Bacteroidota bacterium]
MNKLEKLVPNQFYHIYNRGNNKEDIFVQDENYNYFLNLYDKYISPIGDTYVYCLLKNHFHILLKIKGELELPGKYVYDNSKLYLPFSNFFNSYSKSINKRFNRSGSLFEERFKRKAISTNEYLMCIICYIHLNPQKHQIVKDFRKYPYSSYQSIISDKNTKLKRQEVINFFGSKVNFIEFHNGMSIVLNKLLIDIEQQVDGC